MKKLRCGSQREFCTADLSCAALASYSFAVAVSPFRVAILLIACAALNI